MMKKRQSLMGKMVQCCVPPDHSPKRNATRVHKSSTNNPSYSIFDRIGKENICNEEYNSFDFKSRRREFLKDLIYNLNIETSLDSSILSLNNNESDATKKCNSKVQSHMYNIERVKKVDDDWRKKRLCNTSTDAYAEKNETPRLKIELEIDTKNVKLTVLALTLNRDLRKRLSDTLIIKAKFGLGKEDSKKVQFQTKKHSLSFRAYFERSLIGNLILLSIHQKSPRGDEEELCRCEYNTLDSLENHFSGWIQCQTFENVSYIQKENVNADREISHNSRYFKPIKKDFFNETNGTYSLVQNKTTSSVATLHNLALNINSNGNFGFSIDGKFPCEVSHLSAHAMKSGLQIGDQIFAVNGSHLYNQPSNVVASFISQASSCVFLTVVRRTSNSMVDSGVGHSAFEAPSRNNIKHELSSSSSLRSTETILKKRKYEDSINSRKMVKKWKIKSVRNFYSSQQFLNDDKENHIPSILNEGMLFSDSSFKSSNESLIVKPTKNIRCDANSLNEKNGFSNVQNFSEPESSGISSFHTFQTNKFLKQQNDTITKKYNISSPESVTPKKALNFSVVKKLNFNAPNDSFSDTTSTCSYSEYALGEQVLELERMFFRAMENFYVHYQKSLFQSGFFTRKQCQIIFQNIQTIKNISKHLCEEFDMLESITTTSFREKQNLFHDISTIECPKNIKNCTDHNNNHTIPNDSDSALDSADSFEIIFRKYTDSQTNQSTNDDTILYNNNQPKGCTEKTIIEDTTAKCSFISSKQIVKVYVSKIEMISQSYLQYMSGLDDALKKLKHLSIKNKNISNLIAEKAKTEGLMGLEEYLLLPAVHVSRILKRLLTLLKVQETQENLSQSVLQLSNLNKQADKTLMILDDYDSSDQC